MTCTAMSSKLRLISQHNTPPAAAATWLRAVLKAELRPGLTVEDACHFEMCYEGVELDAEGLKQFIADSKLLRQAGLGVSPSNGTTPDAIVLHNKRLFKRKFPHLAPAIPLLEACEGVQPYTDGLGRYPRETRLTVVA